MKMEQPDVPQPDWDTVREGDVLITNMRDGIGMLAVQVMNGKLHPVRRPFKPDQEHDEPFGHVRDALMPLRSGIWRKVFDARTGWRRD